MSVPRHRFPAVSVLVHDGDPSGRPIVDRIARRLQEHGLTARVRDAATAGDPGGACRAVVVGGSVHEGRHAATLVWWMHQHASALNALPTAVYSVSMAAADPRAGGRALVARRLAELVRETGVRPEVTATFAGALPEPAGDVAVRWLRTDHGITAPPTTTLDLTDWAAVDRFADEAAMLAVEGASR